MIVCYKKIAVISLLHHHIILDSAEIITEVQMPRGAYAAHNNLLTHGAKIMSNGPIAEWHSYFSSFSICAISFSVSEGLARLSDEAKFPFLINIG